MLEKCSICAEVVKAGHMALHRKEKAQLHVELLEAMLQQKDAESGHNIESRLTALESTVMNLANKSFTWLIPDVTPLLEAFPRNKSVLSPRFVLQGVPFFLEFYPNGDDKSPPGFCSLHFFSDARQHHSKVTVHINMTAPISLERIQFKTWAMGTRAAFQIPSKENLMITATLVFTTPIVEHSGVG